MKEPADKLVIDEQTIRAWAEHECEEQHWTKQPCMGLNQHHAERRVLARAWLYDRPLARALVHERTMREALEHDRDELQIRAEKAERELNETVLAMRELTTMDVTALDRLQRQCDAYIAVVNVRNRDIEKLRDSRDALAAALVKVLGWRGPVDASLESRIIAALGAHAPGWRERE